MKKYKNRTIEKKLKDLINTFPVIMITGPRQVGKTTLLEYISFNSKTKINYVTLDNLNLRKLAKEDPELFLRSFEPPLIIDEFQYAPNLLSYIKINTDKARLNELFGDKRKTETLYYLTGSQSFRTMELTSESLAGRVGILDLHAFSTRELENLKEELFIPEIKELKKKTPTTKLSTMKLYERIFKGSYPEINVKTNTNIEDFYGSYLKTYIERDIRELINIKNEEKFLKFISSVAARTAQEYNASDIADNVGINSKTVDEWISILKNTGLVYLLQPYSNNNLGTIIKRPKIYFMDTGLACYLTGYTDYKTLEKSAYNGPIFETYIITEIIKTFTNNGKDARRYMYYYRDKKGKEIDLLISYNNKIYPIEIKKSANPGKEAIKNFNVTEKFNQEIGNGIVLCMSETILPIDKNNFIVPIEYI